MHYIGETEKNLVTLNVEGGSLEVSFDVNNGKYNNVWLIGPATFVYKGLI
jgi:diaminopimelate epimerase